MNYETELKRQALILFAVLIAAAALLLRNPAVTRFVEWILTGG